MIEVQRLDPAIFTQLRQHIEPVFAIDLALLIEFFQNGVESSRLVVRYSQSICKSPVLAISR